MAGTLRGGLTPSHIPALNPLLLAKGNVGKTLNITHVHMEHTGALSLKLHAPVNRLSAIVE